MGKVYFQVKPRYTPGSPGMVDEDTAQRVANEELRAFSVALSGGYGEKEKALAETVGLAGIAEAIVERRNGWDVRDLLTDATIRRETVKAKALRKGYRVTQIFTSDPYGDIKVPFNVIEILPGSDRALWVKTETGMTLRFENRDEVKVEYAQPTVEV